MHTEPSQNQRETHIKLCFTHNCNRRQYHTIPIHAHQSASQTEFNTHIDYTNTSQQRLCSHSHSNSASHTYTHRIPYTYTRSTLDNFQRKKNPLFLFPVYFSITLNDRPFSMNYCSVYFSFKTPNSYLVK